LPTFGWRVNMEKETLSHGSVEAMSYEQMDWPAYFVAGEGHDGEDFVPAYFRVGGPNGPVSYKNRDSEEPIPITMYGFAMEMMSDDARECLVEDTPFEPVASKW
jgi:hypothetical protein